MWYGPRSSAREARSFQSSFCPPRPNSGISFFHRTSTDDPIEVGKPILEDPQAEPGSGVPKWEEWIPISPGVFGPVLIDGEVDRGRAVGRRRRRRDDKRGRPCDGYIERTALRRLRVRIGQVMRADRVRPRQQSGVTDRRRAIGNDNARTKRARAVKELHLPVRSRSG